jgi:germination protein M
MKRCLTLLLCLTTLICLAGCGVASTAPEGTGLSVYYVAEPQQAGGGDILAAARVDWTEQAKRPPEVQAREALHLLLEGNDDPALSSPIPAGTHLLGCSINGSMAVVDFSAAYGQLSGMKLSMADYCVTLTLTQIAPIRMVCILVNGLELSYRHSNILLAGDALLTSTEDVVRTFAARLYFRGPEGELAGEDRLLTLYEGESRGTVIMNALLAGPESTELTPLLPHGFAALSLRAENGVCYLNLPGTDEELLPEDPEQQALLVQSVTRSLCSIDGVDAVQILLDGEMRGTFGTVDISYPLTGE